MSCKVVDPGKAAKLKTNQVKHSSIGLYVFQALVHEETIAVKLGSLASS